MAMPPMRRPIAEVQRAKLQRVEQASAQDTWVIGRIIVDGVGEVQIDVPFPVLFGEKPLPILGGGELDISDSPEQYNYPTAEAIVVGWDTTSNGTHYKGARLAITTTGRIDQRVYVTFAFVGLALSNWAE